MNEEWKEILENPPENWRDKWNKRSKLTRFDTRDRAGRWIEKHQKKYDSSLLCDVHVKDGFVVYIQK
ncbi:hypothetical protein [Paenibacillus gallinarum]|uniref:Uncharacterized protein n=1 Tax=Paenibacillus gallinarum TaxID=2762232 RepID=A0ABR8T3L2_9BACL|nr:hypothetical protein [Paenibacillus gallinarum]MBD7970372.1 hypothetical protein [Paenibacillus gallinarum]